MEIGTQLILTQVEAELRRLKAIRALLSGVDLRTVSVNPVLGALYGRPLNNVEDIKKHPLLNFWSSEENRQSFNVHNAGLHRISTLARRNAQNNYWAAMTPEQRRQEVQKRMQKRASAKPVQTVRPAKSQSKRPKISA